jgi:hypothetical protein
MDDSIFIISRDIIRYRPHARSEYKRTPPGRSVRRQHARVGGKTPLKVWAVLWRTRDKDVNAWCERKGIKATAVES